MDTFTSLNFTFVRSTELERNGFKEQVAMYQESLAAKDEVVMSLTHQLAEAEKGRDPVSVSTYRQLPEDDTLTELIANSDRLVEIERLKVGCQRRSVF